VGGGGGIGDGSNHSRQHAKATAHLTRVRSEYALLLLD